MRRIVQLAMVGLTAGVLAACSTPDQLVQSEDIPTAGVRFINAVPDTNLMDFRYVDFVENSDQYKIGFRNQPTTTAGVTASLQIQYKNTRAGSRHLRIFLNDTLASVASTVLKDTTLNLVAGKLYTAMMWGSARAGAMKFVVFEETAADPGANVALRVLNTTTGAVEVRTFASTGTLPTPATFTVPAMSFSSYSNSAPAQINYNVQPVGGGAVVVPQALALIGQPAACSIIGGTCTDIEGTPGTTQAGSAVTGIIFPASTVGSKAIQFAAPGMSFVWDRRPPRPAGT